MAINPQYGLEDLFAELFPDGGEPGGTGVSMPGRVVSYDRATQRANIRPCITRRLSAEDDDEEDVFEAPPELPSVPVVWPSGGGSFFHPELAAGDPVLLVVSDADYAVWARTGDAGDPSDAREHHYAHTFAIPGPRPRSALLPSGRTIVAAGGEDVSLAVAEHLDAFLTAWMTAAVAAGVSATTPQQAIAAVQSGLSTARSNLLLRPWASSRYKQDAEPVLP